VSRLIDDAAFLTSVAVSGSILLTGVAWGVRKAVKLSHRMGDFLDDFMGKPARPGVSATPGVMVRLSTIEAKQETLMRHVTVVQEQVAVVHHEVRPNEGESMKDQLTRLDDAQTARDA
jgi:hypothetical protein